MFAFLASGATDIGLRRSNNEDAYLAVPEIGLFAVADGMGGEAAGEVASAIFVETVRELFGRSPCASPDEATVLVREIFRRANQRMVDDVVRHPDHYGMGCTAELLVFSGDRYVLGHVGDSRTYLFREGKVRALTKDHSLVQQQVDLGVITPAQAKSHPMKNVVLRALGANIELSLDLLPGRVLPNDLFLLCSDGLTDMLEDAEIEAALAARGTPTEKAARLIERALSAGGGDNVTVVLCQALPS
jgi:PPM family protein phosphatase